MSDEALSVAALYATEQDRLRRRLIGRGLSAQQAADAVQELFLRLLRTPRTDVRNASAYLSRAADSIAIDHWRREQRAERLFEAAPPDALTVADPSPSVEARLMDKDLSRDLEQALATLPPRCREVLLLHKFEELSYAEIAQRLGISRNTVMVHLANAMALLRRRMREKKQPGAN
jgi:RNA polymerase sigma-70 factor (ECF subfamily)